MSMINVANLPTISMFLVDTYPVPKALIMLVLHVIRTVDL